MIKVTDDGENNEAGYAYSLDGGNTFSEEMTVPLNGEAVLANTGLTAKFTEAAGGDSFKEGDTQLAGEGDVWEYWKRASGMSTKMQQWQTYPQIRTYAIESHTSAQYVRLRSAYRDYACITWSVNSSGYVSYSNAVRAFRCAPVCVIC